MKENNLELIKNEGWKIVDGRVRVYEKDYPIVHPCLIHLNIYKHDPNPEIKFKHMKAAHDYLWPQDIPSWHFWTERRFRKHCEGKNYQGWAGGASCAKSYDAAKIALIFWFAAPKQRGVIIASTTLIALESRVWGYCVKLLNTRRVKIPCQYMGGNSPRILAANNKQSGEIRDSVHGIFAVAARQGSDESAINTWIGRHPDDALLLVLDECTDLNPAISKAFVNLDSTEKAFQCIAIGNSNSWHDLHGMICYPKNGIESVNPQIDTEWETTQKNGICLFFPCYESPAIHEPLAAKRKILSKFLITQEQIDYKEKQYGKESESFYRFVLGFWRNQSGDSTILSRPFLEAHNVSDKPEWLGIENTFMAAGLDPAFSSGGDSCVLRLAQGGQTVDGGVILDFKDKRLLFNLEINAKMRTAVEIQIAEQTIKILSQFGIPIQHLCIDANGQGRALGGTIQLKANALVGPTKIYSVRSGDTNVKSFDVKIMEAYELWSSMRDFIEHNQIKGLDQTAMMQLTNRLVVTIDTKGKPSKPHLENKIQFKNRMRGIMPSLAHSPDEADGACLALQSAIIHSGFRLGQRAETRKPADFFDEKMMAHRRELKIEEQKHGGQPIISSGFSMGIEKFAGTGSKFRS